MKTSLQLLLSVLTFIPIGLALRAETSLTGGGSSFDQPAFSKWFEAYRDVDPSIRFNYQPNGSGFGQSSLLNQTIDFGASDFTMDDANLAKSKSGPILQIPIVAGAVVLSYNLPDNPKLHFDGETIAEIFLGKIVKWNDAKISALNPKVKLPDIDIVTVHRSDKSGTSYIFTDYLSGVSKEWESKVGRDGAPKWPGGIGGKGNLGVSGQIKQLPGAIGYIELAFAVQNNLSYGDVKNQAGKFIDPSPDSVSAALKRVQIPDDFRFSLVNAPGEDAYPISGTSWVLIYQNQKDPEKGKAMTAFLKWAVTEGQKISLQMNYAPLPAPLQERVVAKIASIKI